MSDADEVVVGRGLTKRFFDKESGHTTTALKNIDFAVLRGSITALVGPDAAGKTTLMRLMAGLDSPSTGRILWQDDDVTGMKVQRRDIAMVYQQFINYPSMTVFENIVPPYG